MDAIHLLSTATGVDFRRTEFSKEHEWKCCTVRNRDGVAVFIVVFEFKNEFDAHMTTVCVDKRVITRGLLTAIFCGIFAQAKRVTALIDADNHDALTTVWRLGFRQEGYLRRGFDGRRDAVLMGLLPEDSPYVQGQSYRLVRVSDIHPEPLSVN